MTAEVAIGGLAIVVTIAIALFASVRVRVFLGIQEDAPYQTPSLDLSALEADPVIGPAIVRWRTRGRETTWIGENEVEKYELSGYELLRVSRRRRVLRVRPGKTNLVRMVVPVGVSH